MTTRMTSMFSSLLLGALALFAVGCEQPGLPPVDDAVHTAIAETRLGDPCDWRAMGDCGPGFQCDRITDEGEHLAEGICMLAQGAHCPDPSGLGLVTEFCGRSLSCQPSSREREDFICLPNSCIDDSECRTGERCRNASCRPSGPGCHAL